MPSKRLFARVHRAGYRWAVLALGAFVGLFALAASTVPTDIQIPGTQPVGTDNPPTINTVGNCGCHDFSPGSQPPEAVPVFGWWGGMMANAGRDPLFWSTLAVAEQDFVHDDVGLHACSVSGTTCTADSDCGTGETCDPLSGGVGDLCLHCHSVKGWIEGRSTPTNGSGLNPTTDNEGIMCEFCHLLTNPDSKVSWNGIDDTTPPPEGTYGEEQNAPFLANDDDGTVEFDDGYYGGAQYVLNSGGTRLGPLTDHGAKHNAIPSPYFRDPRFCGTCHDVSNPAVGDLAADTHGAIFLPAGFAFSGVPNGPVGDKAALNNDPSTYGIVERTFSEFVAGALDTTLVSNFSTLIAADSLLGTTGGALDRAYQRALWGNCSTSNEFCKADTDCGGGETCVIPANNTDYEDGTPRYFTCQTCHMSASGGDAAQQGRPSPHKGEIRPDLPRHDQTGMSYWIQDAVVWQDDNATLVFGGPVSADERTSLDAGQLRAGDHLRSAAVLTALQSGDQIEVKVTNLTGHKLISGYPEGRRMWLNLVWKSGGTPIKEDGAYGSLGLTVNDKDGDPWVVESILAPASTKVYEAKPAMTKEWASQLLALNYPPDMALEWDRLDHSIGMTLGELAAEPAATKHPTFHFALNNAVYKDNRIPPYGFDYDTAQNRNALPVPDTQYGDPGAGGTYVHHDEVYFNIPPGADSVDVRLLYQMTSWEYIQFLWLQNYGSDDPRDGSGNSTGPGADGRTGDSFLGLEGVHMMDAWLNTGMSAPFEMFLLPGVSVDSSTAVWHVPGEAGPMLVDLNKSTGELEIQYTPAIDAVDHTIYYGDLANVSTYSYSGSRCYVGVDGSTSFDPGLSNAFFLIVGNEGAVEGPYGIGDGDQRPEATGVGICDYPLGS